MSILLTEVFGLLQPFVDSYIKSVINKAGLDCTKNRKERYVIEREKNKTINELHSLIDVNEDNGLITSGDFYDFIKYNASNLIYQLLEANSYIVHNKSSEGQVKDLLALYDTEFCGVSLYEKSLGADFIKRFFDICFRFKKNLFISLIHGDTKHLLEYELNEDMLLKINENIETVLDYFQRVYDHMELNSTTIHEKEHNLMDTDGRKTIESFSELFEDTLIFEEKENAKRLKDVFVWPEYRADLLKCNQDDLEQAIGEFLKGKLKIFLYSKGVSKLRIDKNYNLLVILGMGGMGKSSLLGKIAYDIIHGAIQLDVKNIFFVKFSSMEYRYNNLLQKTNVKSNYPHKHCIYRQS